MRRRDQPASGSVASIDADSLAEEAGLQPGDRIVRVNGRPIRDEIDYRFKVSEEFVELAVQRGDDEQLIEFEKPADEPLGIEFDGDAFDGTTLCNNRCFFCFLKGLPKGLRRPLYVKDDDYRLSFLHGNFVTLTNLDEEDWSRLQEQRLSPLNVSVHATNPILRRTLLGNPRAPDVRPQLRRLDGMGIDVQAQIVVCPGVNDGAALDESIGELIHHPNVLNVGVVPVGQSVAGEERIAHPGMRAHTTAESRSVVRQIRKWQRQARAQRQSAFVFASDEYYLAAGARLPASSRYEGFPQWENGIGMTRTLLDDWARTRRRIRSGRIDAIEVRHVTLCCGTLIAPTLSRIAAEASELLDVRIDVVSVPNRLFGSRVNVSGLLPGRDFIDALTTLRPDRIGDHIVLPRASLDYFGARFLDDTPANDVSAAVDRPVTFAYTLDDVIKLMTNRLVAPLGTPQSGSNGRAWTTAVPT
jgi:putative radical SAM enzyme (TIGR03279 family)